MEPVNQAPTTSLVARLFNVFATPAEVFDEVRDAKPAYANWLAPTLLAVLAGLAWAYVVFSQEAITQGFREQIIKQMEANPQAGATQASMDKAVSFGLMAIKVSFGFGAVFVAFIRVFWWALILWLLGKWFLKANFSYGKALEVAGLTTMIGVLGVIVVTLVDMYVGQIVNVSPALLLLSEDPKNPHRALLSLLDVFDIWLTVVMSVGLSRLARVPWSKALILTFCYWLVMAGLLGSFALLGALLGHLAKPH